MGHRVDGVTRGAIDATWTWHARFDKNDSMVVIDVTAMAPAAWLHACFRRCASVLYGTVLSSLKSEI